MTKNDEKRMVKIAEREIEIFAKEWQKNPYLWESETDIHAELYIRIKTSLRKKFPLRKYEYKDMAKKEYFDWVYCKPKTYIKGANYPDLVIYKDIGKKHNVGDRENEPMLWACEIKYATEWSSDILDSNIRNDIEKLTELLKKRVNRTGIDYASILILVRWMKKYKHEHHYEKGKKRIDNRLSKITAILNNLKNDRIKKHFYQKVKIAYDN